jgi:FlaG/FlaF family flagellin (archaellin)
MRSIRPEIAVTVTLAALLLSSCGGTVEANPHVVEHAPATIETIEGSDLVRVRLTDKAAERLDIQTTTVQSTGQGSVVPSTAVLVDTDGVWWVYTVAEPLVFVRHEIAVVTEDEGLAYLSSGPPVGTEVVTVGVAELSGAEAEISH